MTLVHTEQANKALKVRKKQVTNAAKRDFATASAAAVVAPAVVVAPALSDATPEPSGPEPEPELSASTVKALTVHTEQAIIAAPEAAELGNIPCCTCKRCKKKHKDVSRGKPPRCAGIIAIAFDDDKRDHRVVVFRNKSGK